MNQKYKVRIYKSPSGIVNGMYSDVQAGLYTGDCLDLLAKLPDASVDLVVTSPPYCIGMEYEKETTVKDFVEAHRKILPEVIRVTKPGGSICWQVGYHVLNRTVYPLDYAVFSILSESSAVALRNRIVWTFSHGLHSNRRFSGRHETVLWYTKGENFFFNLDDVRVPQKYPGKRHYKGPFKGQFSGNPLGKNPGDVWDIPNVKGNHVEKLQHPCQFPVALVQRLVRSLCPIGGLVFDPYMGVATTAIGALVEGRRFIGAEINKKYVEVANFRLTNIGTGDLKFRPLDRPIFQPDPRSEVATLPAHFQKMAAE